MISSRLVELMGGAIAVQSVVDKGSSFSFTVVLGSVPEKTSERQGSIELLAGMRALVVDDNKTSMHAMAHVLRSFGMSVTALSDGPAAIAEATRARAMGQPYKVALVDWQMPQMNGFEVIEALNRSDRASGAVFIMVTAHERALLMGDLERQKLNGLVLKPATASTLLETISSALGHAPHADEQADLVHRMPQVRAGARMLVVEDNLVNQIVARETLRAMGADVTVSSGGEGALERLGRGECFDVVLMDVQMPGMDGIETTRALRGLAHCAKLPIVAMTAHALEGDRQSCLDAGMDDYLTKPIDPDVVAACLSRWIPPQPAVVERVDEEPVEVDLSRLEELAALIPGFSPAEAVARLGGDAANLVNLLEVFTHTSEEVARRLREQLRRGESEDLMRTLHSLRGSASSISLDVVVEGCLELERAIGKQGGGKNIAETGERLCGILEAAVDGLLQWRSSKAC
jgi:two-component system sensor histidine kinase/response regulator